MKLNRTNKFFLFLSISILICILMPALADDVTLSTDQSEYYFLTGSDKNIPFTIDSNFQGTVDGTLQYSLEKSQDQGGLSLSQTSTQSQSFPVAPGKSVHALTLGSVQPESYKIDLVLRYSENGKEYEVKLPPISVNFVSDQKDIKEEKKTLKSSTSEANSGSSASGMQNQMNAIDQQMQQMEQEQNNMLQQMMSSNGMSTFSSSPSYASQNPEQALQNNQMSSSSSSLMKQLNQETQENKKAEEDLKKRMEGDSLLNEQAKDLQNAGYNQTSGKIVPKDDGEGEVSVDFKDASGNSVSLKGSIKNNSVQSLSASTNGEMPVPSTLKNNETWNNLKNNLQSEGMQADSGSVTRDQSQINVNQSFKTPDGRNATLKAVINNGNVEKIEVEQDTSFPLFWLLGILLVILLIVLCLIVILWYYLIKSKKEKMSIPEKCNKIDPIDYRKKIKDMTDEALKTYETGDKKNGYVLLGQAFRLYYSFYYKTGQELTTEEILNDEILLKHKDKEDIMDILHSCSMVEYAKGAPDDEKFFRYHKKIKDIISDITEDKNT